MTVYEKLKQEQDSLLEKEGSMKMDQNLTVSYEEQKAQWQEKRKQQQKENAEIFKKLAPASFVYALIYPCASWWWAARTACNPSKRR